jgi:hypothetical protein
MAVIINTGNTVFWDVIQFSRLPGVVPEKTVLLTAAFVCFFCAFLPIN